MKKCQLTLEEALSAKSELQVELQELDAQHETAMAKVIAMRDEALEKLQAMVSLVPRPVAKVRSPLNLSFVLAGIGQSA